jgi:Mor family transcriptional regulator
VDYSLRNKEIEQALSAGENAAEIAERYKITRTRVWQIVLAVRTKREAERKAKGRKR